VFNAAVKLGIPVADLCRGFDSVSACLSKGLGAPAGTVLVGSKPFIAEARRWRKMLGGGMRQAGVLAAAGLYALEHHVERLAEDHENALALAKGLSEVGELKIAMPQTNIVFVTVAGDQAAALQSHLLAHGVRALIGSRTRLVTHLDISRAQVKHAVAAFKSHY
jgi:threonine aldolase